jgi:hypothetical protein
MTTKNGKNAKNGKARQVSSSASKARTKMPAPITRFGRRYAPSVATLALAASVVPLFSTSASAAPEPISPQSTAPVVSDGSGLATTEVDANHDVVLFTQSSGAATWDEQTIATSARAKDYFDPEIASNGTGGLVVAALDGKGHLWSWSGSVGTKFHKSVVSETSTYSTPSIAYSSAGGNFVVASTDAAHDVDFWYQSGSSWAPELVQSGQHVPFVAAVVTLTDTGAVVVATDYQSELDVFYQPLFASGWTLTSTSAGGFVDPSVAWSGTDVLVAIDQAGVQFGDQSLDVISYSDKGIFAANTALGESTTTGSLTGTAIAWSGFNVGVVSQDAQGDGALNFFYSDSDFVFHEESVAVGTPHRGYNFFPGIAVANDSVEITDVSNADLYGFSQAVGASGWTLQVIAK